MIHFNNLFFPNDNNPNHIKSLDGVRGLAVILVVLAHGSEMSDRINFLYDLKFLGRVGVFIFFVLSAYLLDMYISRALISKKTNLIYWLNYFLRRFLRIYPLFLISLCIYWVFGKLNLIPSFISGYLDIKNHLFLTDAKAMYWSIGVEFKYYLVSPLILVFCDKVLKWKKTPIYLMLLLVMIIPTIVFFVQPYEDFRFINYLSFFICGTMIAISELYINVQINKKVANIMTPLILSMILFGIFFTFKSLNIINNSYNIVYLTYSPFIAFFVYLIKNGSKSFFSNLFETPFLRFIGNISYSLYLFHVLFVFIVHKYGFQNYYLNAIVYMALSIGFSSLTYILIEFPLSKIRLTSFNLKEIKSIS